MDKFKNVTHLEFSALVFCRPGKTAVNLLPTMNIVLPVMANVRECAIRNFLLTQIDVMTAVKMLKQLRFLHLYSNVTFSKSFYTKLVNARKQMQNHQEPSQRYPLTIYVYQEYIQLYKGDLDDLYDGKMVILSPIMIENIKESKL